MTLCNLHSAVLLAATALAACATPGPGTPSGRLEAKLASVDQACMRERILDHALSSGFVLKSSTDLQLTVQRVAPPSFLGVLASTGYGPPQQRLVFTFARAGDGDLRLLVELLAVTNAQTPYERTQEVRPSAEMQREFDAMARRAELNCPVRR